MLNFMSNGSGRHVSLMFNQNVFYTDVKRQLLSLLIFVFATVHGDSVVCEFLWNKLYIYVLV
ncbi:MAG: hypothetical protein C0507_19650 [Cyanobacteria bacterium PR.3.49]|nr:hypothetical protein [Cyanobacteria bacterium PR.3.49]